MKNRMAPMQDKPDRTHDTEPAADPADEAARSCFVMYQVGKSVWRAYVDQHGEQLFTRQRAARLLLHLKSTNPNGWSKLAIAEIGKQGGVV